MRGFSIQLRPMGAKPRNLIRYYVRHHYLWPRYSAAKGITSRSITKAVIEDFVWFQKLFHRSPEKAEAFRYQIIRINRRGA